MHPDRKQKPGTHDREPGYYSQCAPYVLHEIKKGYDICHNHLFLLVGVTGIEPVTPAVWRLYGDVI